MILLCISLLPFLSLRAQQTIVIDDSSDVYAIGKSISVLRDHSGRLTIDSVESGTASRRFQESRSLETNFGHTADVIWVRFTLDNNAADRYEWLLSEDYSIVDRVSFYSSDESGKYRQSVAGIDYPMNARELKHRLIVFPIHLKPSQKRTFFLRFESQFSLPLYLRIWNPSAFYQAQAKQDLLFGLFYGGLLIMAVYNLFLFFAVKDLSYLYYFLYAVSIGYYQACMDGLVFRFITPEFTFLNTNMVQSIYFAGIFWMLFVKEFLQVDKYSAALNRLFKILIIVFFFIIAFSFLVSSRIGAFLSAPIWLAVFFVNLSAGIYCLRKGNVNAGIYLIASFVFFVGASLRMIRVAGLEQESLFTESFFKAGILIEMAILSFALGNRINTLRRDEEREKALIRSRIAGDLHDEIGSNLSSISVASQMVGSSARLDESERQQLKDITETAKETADSIRDIIWFINPEHDRSEDLVIRMKDTAAKLLQGIRYDFVAVEGEMIKSKDLRFRRSLFLIFKEILNNIVKHSQAESVSIRLKGNPDQFRLEVADDGIGFDERSVDPRHGEGIKNLRRRAAEIGCELRISSAPGKGTRVIVMMKTG